jgi:hypothetical protein
VIDPRRREPTFAREKRDPGEAAGLLVDRARDLERAIEPDARRQDALDRDHRSREPALHVARAAAIEAAVPDHARKRVDGPPLAGRHDVDVAVEVDAAARTAPADPRDDVDPWIALAVAGRALGADVVDLEPAPGQTLPEVAGARPIAFARRIDGREAHELAGELDQRVPLLLDAREQGLKHRRLRMPMLEQPEVVSI